MPISSFEQSLDEIRNRTKISTPNPWLDSKFVIEETDTKQAALKIEDLAEKLGLIGEGDSFSLGGSSILALKDTPGNYGIKYQFLQTDGLGRVRWAWPFFEKRGKNIYYKTGDVQIEHTLALYGDLISDKNPDLYNSFLGTKVGRENIAGYENVGIGYHALYKNTTGYKNIGVGTNALNANISGYSNIGIGTDAVGSVTTGHQNIGIGGKTLNDNLTSHVNIAIGEDTLYSHTAGDDNIGIGYQALYSNVTATGHVGLGRKAGYSCTSENACVFIGYEAGLNETGGHKLYISNSNTATPLIYGEFDNGLLCINDNANTKMTAGITIQQGANDDEILAVKSSDVAHGITDHAETDTYGSLRKWSSTAGALAIDGYGELAYGLLLRGNVVTDNTDKDATALAPVAVRAYKKSGTDRGAMGADANIFVVQMNDSTRFIVDEDGDILYDGGASAYDHHDDALACRDLSMVLSKQFNQVMVYNQEKLTNMGVLKPFVSTKALNMLKLGAIGQLYEKNKELEAKVRALENKVEKGG